MSLPVVGDERRAEGPLRKLSALAAVGSRACLLGRLGRGRHLRDEWGWLIHRIPDQGPLPDKVND